MGQEKRAWTRMSVALNARCRPVDVASYTYMKITDIHHEGCCLEGEVSFPVGQELRITTNIPIEGEVYMAGKVAWSKHVEDGGGYRTGVKFVVDSPVAEAAQFKLYNYCSVH